MMNKFVWSTNGPHFSNEKDAQQKGNLGCPAPYPVIVLFFNIYVPSNTCSNDFNKFFIER